MHSLLNLGMSINWALILLQLNLIPSGWLDGHTKEYTYTHTKKDDNDNVSV